MRSFRILGPLIACVALTACADRGPVLTIGVTAIEGGCDIAVAGRHLDLRAGSGDQFSAFLRSWRGRRADIRADLDTPYRCVGSLIFALQRAHFRVEDVTFNGMRWNDPRLREGLGR